jgi:hypothetical protein
LFPYMEGSESWVFVVAVVVFVALEHSHID